MSNTVRRDIRPGWFLDEDNWHYRPQRDTDNPVQGDCHVFRENGRIYCRDAEQAATIDAGKSVKNP